MAGDGFGGAELRTRAIFQERGPAVARTALLARVRSRPRFGAGIYNSIVWIGF